MERGRRREAAQRHGDVATADGPSQRRLPMVSRAARLSLHRTMMIHNIRPSATDALQLRITSRLYLIPSPPHVISDFWRRRIFVPLYRAFTAAIKTVLTARQESGDGASSCQFSLTQNLSDHSDDQTGSELVLVLCVFSRLLFAAETSAVKITRELLAFIMAFTGTF